MSRARSLAAAAAAAMLLLPGAPGAAAAQARAAAVDSTRGWLGIGLRETLECPSADAAGAAAGRRGCGSSMVVRAVFRSSPAQRAGVAPGDTLVRVDGHALGTEAAADRLRSLRPGEPVELLLGGTGGRRSVTLMPDPRPRAPGPVSVRFTTPEAPGRVSVAVRPRVMIGTADSSLSFELPTAPEVVFDTEALEGIRVDEQGRVFLERGPDQLVRLRQFERMAERLRAVRDSALETARERIRAVRAEVRRGGAPEGSFTWTVAPGGPHRALGAEFWTVSPELARSLRGVEHGMLVLKVLPGTPAAELGLRPGDVLVRLADTPLRTGRDLRAPFSGPHPRQAVTVRWIREGVAMTDTLRAGR